MRHPFITAQLLRRRPMHNQHLDPSQALAAQRMTDQREQAAHALGRGIGPPTRQRPSRAPRWE